MKREIYPRHHADCPNRFTFTVAKDGRRKQLHPRKKFDGCRVYARYTITDRILANCEKSSMVRYRLTS
ncbi:MAG: hypothetical protein ABSB35_10625 [Bryobacteraceae bacterium]|jgi:hypothetical protein